MTCRGMFLLFLLLLSVSSLGCGGPDVRYGLEGMRSLDILVTEELTESGAHYMHFTTPLSAGPLWVVCDHDEGWSGFWTDSKAWLSTEGLEELDSYKHGYTASLGNERGIEDCRVILGDYDSMHDGW